MSRISRGYTRIVNLYPLRFRQRFGEEMPGVFASSLAEARCKGFWAVLEFFMREFITLPTCIAREYIQEIRSGEGSIALQPASPGTNATEIAFNPGPSSTSRRNLFLTGLPHFLIGIFLGLPQVLVSVGILAAGFDGSELGMVLSLGIPILAALGISAYAWKHHWPAWSASWSLYWVFIFIGLVMLLGSTLGGNSTSINTAEMPWLVVLPLGTAYLLYRLARHAKLQGVLAALPIMLLIWTQFLERNPMWVSPEGWIGSAYLATWVTAGLAAMIILRSRNWRTALILALALTALSGLLHATIGIYVGGALPFTEPGPNPRAVAQAFIPPFLLSAAILLGPQVTIPIRQLGRLSGQKGMLAYRVALFGILLILGAILGQMANGSSGFLSLQPSSRLETALAAAGVVLYTVPLAVLILSALQTGKVVPSAWLVLFFCLPLGVPLALVTGAPVGYLDLPENIRNLLLLAAGAWLLLSTWFILKDPMESPIRK